LIFHRFKVNRELRTFPKPSPPLGHYTAALTASGFMASLQSECTRVPGFLRPLTSHRRKKFMHHVLIIHEVADYDAWKKVFDDAAGIREEAGERSYQVLRYESEPRKIVHFSKWTSIAAARAFFESLRLVKIRQEAGVKAPEFIYLEELESGTL
jgi:quinol monooxygenase YgiN